jgi:hypothetical protein
MPKEPSFDGNLRDDPQKEIGHDVVVTIAGEQDVPVTNISYSSDASSSTTQFSSGLGQSIVTTGMEYSGSFEHDGSNVSLQEAVRDDRGVPKAPTDVEITVNEHERTVTFSGVMVESRSKDMPSDDRTSETYDFVAEEMLIS